VISISETVKSKITVKRRIPIGVIEDVSPVQNTAPNVPPVNNSSNWVRLAIIEPVENAPPNVRLVNNSGYRIEPVQAPTLYVDESHLHSSSNAGVPSTASSFEAIIEHIHNINPLPIDLLDSISSFTNDEIRLQYQLEDMISLVYNLPIPPSSSSSVVTNTDSEEKQQESDEANV
jgi:hypothetical protein